MTLDNIDFIRELSSRRINAAPLAFKRYLYSQINWNNRLIMIKGARGTGKTTLMLQRMREYLPDPQKALYVSLDHLWFTNHSLYDVAEYHYLHGGTHLFIDEIHYYKQWQQLLKNLYDDFRDLHIVYTGSSLLQLETSGADLSRRQLSYTLAGLSLREFLAIEGIYTSDAVPLDDILDNHTTLAMQATQANMLLPSYYTYLETGYYPFYKEVESGYAERLEQTIVQVLENDLPSIEDVSFTTTQRLKKMLVILARSAPQTPNMSELYAELETDRNQGMKMLDILARADLLNLLSSKKATLKHMSRPDKIYCDNPNIMAAVVKKPNKGCIRETFFINQLRVAGHTVTYPPVGDFLVDEKWLFEVGGKNKTFDQIANIPDSYLAVDDIEIGWGNRIPLWLFGFMY